MADPCKTIAEPVAFIVSCTPIAPTSASLASNFGPTRISAWLYTRELLYERAAQRRLISASIGMKCVCEIRVRIRSTVQLYSPTVQLYSTVQLHLCTIGMAALRLDLQLQHYWHEVHQCRHTTATTYMQPGPSVPMITVTVVRGGVEVSTVVNHVTVTTRDTYVSYVNGSHVTDSLSS